MTTSYLRITFMDGSTDDIQLVDYDDMLRAMKEYARTGREEVYEFVDIAGSRVAFFISTVQDIFESTAEQRSCSRALTRAVKSEGGYQE